MREGLTEESRLPETVIILFRLTRAGVMVRVTTYSSGLLYKHVLLVLWSVLDQPG